MSDLNKFAQQAKEKAGLNTVEINGKKYDIELLPARQSAMIGLELVKLILPSFGVWVDSKSKEEFVLPEENDMFAEAAMLLVSQMGKVNIADIIDLLTKNVTRDGNPVDVDVEFRGDVAGLMQLIKYALEKNIGPFGDLPQILGLKTQLDKLRETQATG